MATPPVELVHRRASAFTTDVVLTAPRHALGDPALNRAFSSVLSEFARIDAVFSEWRPATPISRLNAAGGQWVAIPPEVHSVLESALKMAALSEGAFDPTFKTLSALWPLRKPGFRPPLPAQVEALRPAVGYGLVDLEPGRARLRDRRTRIGLGGIAKGYAVRRGVALLKKGGLKAFCLRVGGELYCAGEKAPGQPWSVGIQDPRAPDKLVGSLPLRDAAFTTSGDYERATTVDGVAYHHLLDVRTGRPARRSQSATVLAQDPTLADALSTACFVLGPAAALALVEAQPGVELALVDGAGRLHLSAGLRGKVTLEPEWAQRLAPPRSGAASGF